MFGRRLHDKAAQVMIWGQIGMMLFLYGLNLYQLVRVSEAIAAMSVETQKMRDLNTAFFNALKGIGIIKG